MDNERQLSEREALARVCDLHRPDDERSDAGTPLCSCGHDLGWNETQGEHLAGVIAAAGWVSPADLVQRVEAARAEGAAEALERAAEPSRIIRWSKGRELTVVGVNRYLHHRRRIESGHDNA